MAHFSYLAYSSQLRKPEDFGLRLRARNESWSSDAIGARASGAVGLHSAVESGLVEIVSASARGFGPGALILHIKSTNESSDVRIAIPAGTIFETASWAQKQNLLVGRTVLLDVTPGDAQEFKIGAFGMNMACSSPAGDNMFLTGLLIDEEAPMLESQGKVWDHFEGMFSKFRAEAGFPDGAKGKKGKKGKKK